MKKVLIFALIFINLLPLFVLAQNYVPLLPGSPVPAQGDNFGALLLNLYQWGVGIAVILSVVMIILGGVQYMTTDAIGGKEDGRERIKSAVAGLLLALGSFLILNSINTNILKTNLELKELPATGGGGSGGGTGGGGNGSGGGTGTGGGTVDGIPYGGAYNRTMQSALGGDGIERLAQLKNLNGQSYVGGKVSTFGGPGDSGVGEHETGAITGERLRGLDPNSYYIAGRWDYGQTSASSLRNRTVTVYNPKTGQSVSGVRIVDWGPNTSTGRTWDVSPGVARDIGAETDEEVWVKFD